MSALNIARRFSGRDGTRQVAQLCARDVCTEIVRTKPGRLHAWGIPHATSLTFARQRSRHLIALLAHISPHHIAPLIILHYT